MIYLDNASTTKIDTSVAAAMIPYLKEEYGNPGTLYALGRRAKDAIDNARKHVADFIGARPEQIIFTSGGTEANNMVFRCTLRHLIQNNKTHIVASAVEHDSVFRALSSLSHETCITASFAKPNQSGVVEARSVENEIVDGIAGTGLVSVMYMNNETGAENPVDEIGILCKERGILFHTDCVQAAGCCRLDVDKLHCDFLSISSHKIHGPKGVGALYVRDPSILEPLISGGSAQEFGLRGGTENVAGIVGFGTACALMRSILRAVDAHTSTMKQQFYNELSERLKDTGLAGIMHVNGDLVIKHGKTLNLRFDGVDGETLLLMLDADGVCVSAGSACRSHESQPSHVLLAMGIDPEDARNSIRVSFSKMNTEAEVKQAAKIMAHCVASLRP